MENNFADLPLADIHLPEAPGYWPLAPGWWILLGLILLAAALIYLWHKRKQRENYRRQALIELQKIKMESAKDPAAFLQAVSLLLKRVALSAQPKHFHPSIKGYDWLNWLDDHCPKLTTKFNSELGQALIVGQYQKSPNVKMDALILLTEEWIKQHKNQWQKKSGENSHV
jgi:Domain of unknown function (DUF4381)